MDQTIPPPPLPRILRRRLTRELRNLPVGTFRELPRNTARAVVAHHKRLGRDVRQQAAERGRIRVWILDTPAK